MRNIVLNIPHSSIYGVFDESIGKWFPTPFFINDCLREHTDWFTDILFRVRDENINDIKAFVFPYSRFVFDVSRIENDPLEEIGQGIIYEKYRSYKRGELTQSEKEKILTIREEYLNQLKESLNEDSILIDCHSFTPREGKREEIYISFNDDWTYDMKINDIIAKEFKKHGYSAKFNYPDSKPITLHTDFRYSAVRIEVNKSIYMSLSTLSMDYNPRLWMRWYGLLKGLYKKLIYSSSDRQSIL